MGLLDSDLKYEEQRTVMVEAPDADASELDGIFGELEANGRAALDADDVPEADRVFERWADCRYVGQAYELLVPVPSGPLDDAALTALAERFEEAHEREYFYRFPEKPVQIVHLRSYAIGLMPSISPTSIAAGDAEPPPDALAGRASVVFAAPTARPASTTRRSTSAARCAPATSSPARRSSSSSTRRPSSRPGIDRPRAARRRDRHRLSRRLRMTETDGGAASTRSPSASWAAPSRPSAWRWATR